MVCKVCSSVLEDGTPVCPHCGEATETSVTASSPVTATPRKSRLWMVWAASAVIACLLVIVWLTILPVGQVSRLLKIGDADGAIAVYQQRVEGHALREQLLEATLSDDVEHIMTAYYSKACSAEDGIATLDVYAALGSQAAHDHRITVVGDHVYNILLAYQLEEASYEDTMAKLWLWKEKGYEDAERALDTATEQYVQRTGMPAPMYGRAVYHSDVLPEMSDTAVNSVLKRAYYTVDGGMALVVCFSNGTDTDIALQRLKVDVTTASREYVASQQSIALEKPCLVPHGGYEDALLVLDRQYVTPDNLVLENLQLLCVVRGECVGTTEDVYGSFTFGSGDRQLNGETDIVCDTNLPPMKNDEVRVSILMIAQTWDGSLAMKLMFANGFDTPRQIGEVDFSLLDDRDEIFADRQFEHLAVTVPANGYAETELLIDKAYVKNPDALKDPWRFSATVVHKETSRR